MKFSKLSSKYQATIPKEIRTLLRIKKGDKLIFEVLPNNNVIIRKNKPLDKKYLKSLASTLEEWDSKLDEDCFNDL